MEENEFREPPTDLKNVKKFRQQFTFIGLPVLLVASLLIGGILEGHIKQAIGQAGILIELFAVAIASWQYFHLSPALIKIVECDDYEVYLQKKHIERPIRNGRENYFYGNKIRERRAINENVRKNAHEYEVTRRKFNQRAFYIFAFGASLQSASLFMTN